MDRKVVVVGAGISGLSVAWFAHRKGLSVRVIEARDRVGGVIATDHRDGYLVELGPNTTLQKPAREEDSFGRLVAQTGLSDRLREAGAAGKRRFVMRGGRIRALPASPPGFLTTRLFSWPAKLRLLREPFIARAEAEETIAAFVERRLGREFLDYAVDPFVSGVYAGNPRELSVRAAVPRIYELERAHGSLIRGAIALGRAARGAGAPAGRQVSFDHGMAVLPETIAARLPAGTVRTGRRVAGLRRGEDGWIVEFEAAAGAGVEAACAVVIALPARETAELLDPLAPEAARLLRAIPYAPIVSAGLGYERARVGHPLDGFGFLAPRREGLRTLGGLFSSTLFGERAPHGKALITAFIGGTTDPEALGLTDVDAFAQIEADLGRVLEIQGRPCFRRLVRHERAIPQYVLGHLDHVAEIDRHLAGLTGLHLRASWRDGISVAECIRNGEVVAERLAQ